MGTTAMPPPRSSPTARALRCLMSKLIRRENLESRSHLVIPTILITEGVHNRVLYTAEELAKFPEAWNGRPVPLYHPEARGRPISANSPDVLEASVLGQLFNCEYEPAEEGSHPARLKAEVWLDEEKAERLAPEVLKKLEDGENIEVSTGLFTEDEALKGNWNGEAYEYVAYNFRPDHLALLPNSKGACSWEDGAGLCRVNAAEPGLKTTPQPPPRTLSLESLFHLNYDPDQPRDEDGKWGGGGGGSGVGASPKNYKPKTEDDIATARGKQLHSVAVATGTVSTFEKDQIVNGKQFESRYSVSETTYQTPEEIGARLEAVGGVEDKAGTSSYAKVYKVGEVRASLYHGDSKYVDSLSLSVPLNTDEKRVLYPHMFKENERMKTKINHIVAALAGLPEHKDIRVLELSHEELRQGIAAKVQEFTTPPSPSPVPYSGYSYVVEVYDDAVIYEVSKDGKCRYFRVGYKTGANEEITLTGTPTEVRRKTVYEDVKAENKIKANENKKKGDRSMDRKTRIEALIKANALTENDRAHFEALEDAAFEAVAGALEGQVKANAAAKAKQDEMEKEMAAKDEKIKANASPKSIDEYLGSAPPEAREALASGIKLHQARKDTLIAGIKANKANKFSDESLKAKSLDELEGLASLAGVEAPSYDGRSTAAPITVNADEVPAAPRLFASKEPATTAK